MLLVCVLVLLVGCSPVRSEDSISALRFGQSAGDYIQWSPDMSEFRTQFSLCTWLRKRYNEALASIVLHYLHNYPHSHDIKVGDNGYWNKVVHSDLYLQGKYNVPDGQWFHVCWTWSTATYTTTVYLNGERIGSGGTGHRELRTGGRMCLGNRATSHETKNSDCIFGGDMFKLNIFNRVLDQSEIRSMASDICSLEEENLNTNRILKWEDIILKERTGNVSEIPTGCNVTKLDLLSYQQETQQRLVLIEEKQGLFENTVSETEGTLKDILRRLQNTEQELERSKEKLDNVTQSLSNTQVELDTTKNELAKTETSLDQLRENLTLSLTSTRVELENTKQELAEAKNNLNISLTSTQDELDTSKKELSKTKTSLDQLRENLTQSLTSTHDELDTTKNEFAKINTKLEQRLENLTQSLTRTLTTLHSTKEELAETRTNLTCSEEQLKAARKVKGKSKWDVLYLDKFLNKKLTAGMFEELESTWDMLDLFVGMNLTEEAIVYT